MTIDKLIALSSVYLSLSRYDYYYIKHVRDLRRFIKKVKKIQKSKRMNPSSADPE